MLQNFILMVPCRLDATFHITRSLSFSFLVYTTFATFDVALDELCQELCLPSGVTFQCMGFLMM